MSSNKYVELLTGHLHGPRQVSWPWLRNFLTSHNLTSQMLWTEEQGYHTVWIEYGRTSFFCILKKGSPDHNNFSTVYLPQVVDNISGGGLLSVTVVDVPSTAQNYRKSFEYEPAGNAMTIYDIRVNDLVGPKGIVYLCGGEFEVDSFAAKGSYLSFGIVDRDDVLGLFGPMNLKTCELAVTNVSGTFSSGQIVTGAISGATATILESSSTILKIRADYIGGFQAGEALSSSAGATATLNAFTEGDVFEIVRSIDNEPLRTNRSKDMRPGGSRKVPSGLYFHVQAVNLGVDPIDLIITLNLARE